MNKMAWRGVVVVAIAIAAAGCDDSTDGSGGSGSTSTGTKSTSATMSTTSTGTGSSMSTGSSMAACTATLTGGLTKTYACNVTSQYSTNDDASGVQITLGADGAIGMATPGQLTANTYEPAGGSEQGGTISIDANTKIWAFESDSMMGSSKFVITSVSTISTQQGADIYEVHGSMTAVATPVMGSTEDVNISITF